MHVKRSKGNFALGEDWKVHLKINNEFLKMADLLINWQELESLISVCYSSWRGRPNIPVEIMLKLLLLKSWFGLSGREVIARAADSFSWCHFLGIGPNDDLPDHSTLHRFQSRLAQHKLAEPLFDLVNCQFAAHGYSVKTGKVAVDASLIKSRNRPPSGDSASKDKDAQYTSKHNKPHFGYKLHVAMNSDSKAVSSVDLAPANVHDSELMDRDDNLLEADEIYADKGYDGRERRERFLSLRVTPFIMRRALRNRPLSNADKSFNDACSVHRNCVERVFADLKRWRNYHTVGHGSLAMNQVQANFLAISYNIMNWVRWETAGKVRLRS